MDKSCSHIHQAITECRGVGTDALCFVSAGHSLGTNCPEFFTFPQTLQTDTENFS